MNRIYYVTILTLYLTNTMKYVIIFIGLQRTAMSGLYFTQIGGNEYEQRYRFCKRRNGGNEFE